MEHVMSDQTSQVYQLERLKPYLPFTIFVKTA